MGSRTLSCDESNRMLTEQLNLLQRENELKTQYLKGLLRLGMAITKAGGTHLIPSDVLADNQVVVSRSVFDAMKDYIAEPKE